MAKKYGPITVEAFVRTRDGGLADADALNEERKRKLATELSVRMLNEIYAAQGIRFFPASRPPTNGLACQSNDCARPETPETGLRANAAPYENKGESDAKTRPACRKRFPARQCPKS